MRRTLAPLLVAGLLGIAACGDDDDKSSSSAGTTAAPRAETTSAKPEADKAMKAVAGRIVDHDEYKADPAAFKDSDVVFFFTAPWCPSCQRTNESLDSDGAPDGLTVVRVDYDSETDLKKQYGVTVQHSFVQVDDSGEKVAAWTGTETGEDIAAKTV